MYGRKLTNRQGDRHTVGADKHFLNDILYSLNIFFKLTSLWTIFLCGYNLKSDEFDRWHISFNFAVQKYILPPKGLVAREFLPCILNQI